MSRIVLDGCRAEPLGSYLKALGVLRLVGGQLDADATASWLGERLVLETTADEDSLVDFFATSYQPTPLLSPWNGGSGFGEKDKRSAANVAVIEASAGERLQAYRQTLSVVRRLVTSADWHEISKREQVARCRNELPDEAVVWIDATIVLTPEDETFAPLFISGGNDGRLELSANFMANLLAVTGLAKLRKGIDSRRLLRSSLLDEDPGPLPAGSSGPYDPGAGGGVNSAPAGEADAMVNPWDYVLTMEGGLLFASGAARRLGTEANMAAVPFCVDVSRVGDAILGDGEDVKGEVWAPIWRRPATAAEVARFIGEGRATWGRRSARNGVDFARAAASLGVDRGIDSFVRHGLIKRFGRSHLAVALDRVDVGRRPEVHVTIQADQWLRGIRRGNLPAALGDGLRRVERTMYRVATAGTPSAAGLALQELLYELARAERAVARGSQPDERARRPMHGLRARDWLRILDDGSPELRLASTIASARDRRGASLGLLVRPVQAHPSGRGLAWREGPPAVDGLGRLPILSVLASALVRRSIAMDPEDGTGSGALHVGFDRGLRADLADVAALVDGRIDEARLDHLVQGLLLLDDWQDDVEWPPASGERPRLLVPPVLAAVGPCLFGHELERAGRDGTRIEVRLGIEAEWPALLAVGRTSEVAKRALQRLRMAGLDPAPRSVSTSPEAGVRLAASAFCRLRAGDVNALLDQTCPPEPHSQEDQ